MAEETPQVPAATATAPAPATKASLKRKGLVGAVVTVVVVAYAVIGAQFGLPGIPDWAYGALGALGVAVTAAEIKTLTNKGTAPAPETKE